MIRLILLSNLSLGDGKANVSQHLMEHYMAARTRLKNRHITGVMIVCGDTVLQIMEGPSETLKEELATTKKNGLQNQFAIISFAKTEQRHFKNWLLRTPEEPLTNEHRLFELLSALLQCEIDEFTLERDQHRLTRIITLDTRSPTQELTDRLLHTTYGGLALT